MEVEVKDINLPVGTVLNVLVDNMMVGSLTLGRDDGDDKVSYDVQDDFPRGVLELDTRNGDFVPNIAAGARVVVATTSGQTIVAGSFATDEPPPPSNQTRLRAKLAGMRINGLTPKGQAEFRERSDGSRRLRVQVERVNLPAGTVLAVSIDGNMIGQLTINSEFEGRIVLNTNAGDLVPAVIIGSRVVVMSQSGMTIVSGVFNTSSSMPSQENDIDDRGIFVEEHYHDFLNREPDESGFNFWNSVIASCGDDAQCADVKRINTSAAFYLSIEFQNTGYVLYRFEKASFNRMPRHLGFLIDVQTLGQGVIVNEPGWEQRLESNKREFAEARVNRPEFRQLYDGLTSEQFVDALFANGGVVPSPVERISLIAGLNSGTETRATVLRKVAENDAFYRKEFNAAFVYMQYVGYLRREPDQSGFNFWLNKLNQFGGDFNKAEMVKAFLLSGEYRDRFKW